LLFLKEIGVFNVFIRTEGNPNMKNSRNVTLLVSILAVGISAALMLRAQETATTVQDGAISTTDWNSASDLEVELKAVESLPVIPADSLPEAGDILVCPARAGHCGRMAAVANFVWHGRMVTWRRRRFSSQ
jgi:hypothetical protein